MVGWRKQVGLLFWFAHPQHTLFFPPSSPEAQSCCLQTSAIHLHSHCPHACISSGAPLKHSAELGTRNKATSHPFSRAVGPFSQDISLLPAKLHHCTSAWIKQLPLQGLVLLPGTQVRGPLHLQEVRLTGQQHTSKGPHKDLHSGLCFQTEETDRQTKKTLSR